MAFLTKKEIVKEQKELIIVVQGYRELVKDFKDYHELIQWKHDVKETISHDKQKFEETVQGSNLWKPLHEESQQRLQHYEGIVELLFADIEKHSRHIDTDGIYCDTCDVTRVGERDPNGAETQIGFCLNCGSNQSNKREKEVKHLVDEKVRKGKQLSLDDRLLLASQGKTSGQECPDCLKTPEGICVACYDAMEQDEECIDCEDHPEGICAKHADEQKTDR